MDIKRILRKFYRFAYLSGVLTLVLVVVVFLIIADASLYENREKHPSPYDKEVSNLFIDCNLVNPKSIIASYQQIWEILKSVKKVKRFIGCQINFDENGEIYSYQFYFDIKPRGKFFGILFVNVGTGVIEGFYGISAYEEYTHFWFYLTEPSLFGHDEITENVFKDRISDMNKKIKENPKNIRTIYVGRDKIEFRFQNEEDSEYETL